MKLMIVDDHPGMRTMIRQIASSQGDAVCECATANEALERNRAFAADCVTMDLRMPGMNSLAATRAILAARPQTRVVIVSAHDHPELREAAREAGARGYVHKDDLGDLKSHLRDSANPASGNPAAPSRGGR